MSDVHKADGPLFLGASETDRMGFVHLSMFMGKRPSTLSAAHFGSLPSLTRFELYEFGARHFATEHNPLKAEDRQGCEPAPRCCPGLRRVHLTSEAVHRMFYFTAIRAANMAAGFSANVCGART